MSTPVEQIKERLSIADVISSYITLEPSGVNYKAKCPFHNEKTPSFFVSTERNSYYCFGCSAKGDIFAFVENFEGVDFRGALKTLATRAGVPLVYETQEVADAREALYRIMEEATVYFEDKLKLNNEANKYLHERGLTDETIANFRVGFAPQEWRSVSDHLIKKGSKEADIERAGLIKRGEKKDNDGKASFYDRFRGRIMFPISDTSGRVIAFSGRIFGRDEADEAKYINSPDTPIFNKGNVLFGIDKAKLAIRKKGYAVVVEGQLDLLMSHQIGIDNTVAVSGTALSSTTVDANNTLNNLGLIRRMTSNVIFAFDGDSAGVRAAGRSALIALSLDMQVKIAVLPEGQDPADIIKVDSNTWKEILRKATNIISFYIDRICSNTDDMRMKGRQIREIVFPYINASKSAIDQATYIKEINSKTNIPESALMKDFEVYQSTHKINTVDIVKDNNISNTIDTGSRKSSIEKQFFGIVLQQESKNWPEDILKKRVDEFIDTIGNDVYNNIRKKYEIATEALSLETEMWYGGNNDKMMKDVSELALNLEEAILQEKLIDIKVNMNNYEISGEIDKAKDLLKQYQNIVTRVQNIKSRRSQ